MIASPAYVPASFKLFEYDDLSDPGDLGRGSRWLPSWQGRLAHPAEEVSLGWVGKNQQQAVVATAALDRHPNEYDRRVNAALLVWGGNQLKRNDQLLNPALAHAAVDELSGRTDRWSARDVLIDGVPVPAIATRIQEETVCGYVAALTHLVFFATVNIDPWEIRIRSLTDRNATSYLLDPYFSHTFEALRQVAPPQS